MKTLPLYPYLQNIVRYYGSHLEKNSDAKWMDENFANWMKTLGFNYPVCDTVLVFPDTFTDKEMMLFKLKWG